MKFKMVRDDFTGDYARLWKRIHLSSFILFLFWVLSLVKGLDFLPSFGLAMALALIYGFFVLRPISLLLKKIEEDNSKP